MSAVLEETGPDFRGYGNRFVAMFDVLGFKMLRQSMGTQGLHAKFQKVIAPNIIRAAAGAHEFVEMNGQMQLVPKKNILSQAYVVFSDTVLLWSYDASYVSFLAILNTTRILLEAGFGTMVPFRGAIGFGDAIMGPDIYVGSAIEDAYAGEQMQAWAGCMLTQSCREFIGRQGYEALFLNEVPKSIATLPMEQQEMARRICKFPPLYDVPIKAKQVDGGAKYSTLQTHVIDWTLRTSDGAASRVFLPSDDAHANTMKRNTITFERWARNRGREAS